jgi:hypothetical protein
MKAKPFSPSATPSLPKAPVQTAGADVNQSNPAGPPSPAAAVRRASAIYKNQGSQPKPEVKHWLESEARLLGGVERESQMHQGSSLFRTEH